MATALGQSVLVENRPGASGNIAAAEVQRASDPYRLLVANTSFTINPHLRDPALPDFPTAKELGVKDFVVTVFVGLWGPPKLPANQVAQLNAAMNAALMDVTDRCHQVFFYISLRRHKRNI